MGQSQTINHHQNLAEVVEALVSAHHILDQAGSDRRLSNLIVLRASQINACASCVDMHLAEARSAGETEERLGKLIVWPHTDLFTESEKAALAWTEALTKLGDSVSYSPLRTELKKHFPEQVISAMTFLIGMINMWNRVGVSNHA